MKNMKLNTIQIHKHIFWNSSTGWGSIEKHDLALLFYSETRKHKYGGIYCLEAEGSKEKSIFNWESNGIGLSSLICKMEQILVKVDGFQRSLDFKLSKILNWRYSEFLVLVPGLSTPRPLALGYNVRESFIWKYHAHRLWIPEGTLKTVNPFS